MLIWILAHCFCCFYMAGVIWTVQLVHYPSFAFVNNAEFIAFNVFHQRMMTYVVMPAMLVEIFSGAWLLWCDRGNILLWLGFALIIGIWASTFFLSVPLHGQLLQEGVDRTVVVRQLVLTNWPRTVGWTLRTVLCLMLLASVLKNKG